ncbi:hypothetical protein TYRP_014441 [Tyrophagus putrescentiae]|nr:hypothetical protein TYRP_014441 [Tyrophagus putrescentiae]
MTCSPDCFTNSTKVHHRTPEHHHSNNDDSCGCYHHYCHHYYNPEKNPGPVLSSGVVGSTLWSRVPQ